MISRNQLKLLHSLRLKKFRDANQAFVVEGVKMVDELLNSDFRVIQVFGTASWIASHMEIVQSGSAAVQEITETELEKASGLVSPNEVIAIASIPEAASPVAHLSGQVILILDRIQDPGNLGSIIRTADWFGIRHVICSHDTADVFSPKVIQATMGSAFRVSVHYADILEFIPEVLKDWNVYAASAGGENLFTVQLDYPAAIIIGNESKGISPELLSLAGREIGIPSRSGGAESLNASVAAGIICSEFFRRLNKE